MIDWSKFSISFFDCSLCGGSRPFVRLDVNELSVRCLSCRASSVTLSLIAVLQSIFPDLNNVSVYELSARGSLVKFLKKSCKKLTCSEYYSAIPSGNYFDGVQCQDVQSLTFSNDSFALCTSTEVFEHIPDDIKGFSEIYRVLKPFGVFIFTVPIDLKNKTVERAEILANGDLKHILNPEYHSDPIREHESILVFRDYGYDILERLVAAGFKTAEIHKPGVDMAWGFSRPIIIAYREKAKTQWLNSNETLIRSV